MKNRKTPALAKITRPGVSEVMARKRLFDWLDAARGKPLIWISSPGGSGKTMLVSSYLHTRNLPGLWYRIDEADADLATFFYYLGLAVKKAAPRKRTNLPLLTPEYLGGIPAFTNRYFEQLSRSLAGDPGETFLLVFDNYQEVTAEALFHEVMARGLSSVPVGIQVMILSREGPPSAFARLRANNQIAVIGTEELSFTLNETRALVRTRVKNKFPDAAVRQLQARTAGWVAGLILMLEAARINNTDPRSFAWSAPQEVFDYFANEIFDRIDKEQRIFLLKTAFLPRISAAEAEKLTGNTRAGAIFSRLYEDHFFTEQLSQAYPVFQFHPLFRAFLLFRAKSYFLAEELSRVRRSAAALSEEAGQVEDAARLLTDDEDWPGLVRLILAHAKALTMQGRGKILEEWLVAVPVKVREANPWLLYWLGVCKLPFNTRESRSCFEKAFHRFTSENDRAGALVSWSGAMETIFLERTDFSRILPWITWMDNAMGDKPAFPTVEIELMVVTSMMGAISFHVPHYPKAELWVERAGKLAGSDIDIEQRVRLAMNLLIYHVYMGDHAEVSLLIKTLGASAGPAQLSPLTKISWHVMEAVNFHMVKADGAASLDAVRKGLELAGTTGVHVLDFLLHNLGAYGALTAENHEEADRFTAALGPMLSSCGNFDVINYHCMLSSLDLCKGEFRSALEHARSALQLGAKTDAPMPMVFCHIGAGHALFELGEHKKALEQLRAATTITNRIKKRFRWQSMLLLPEAYFAFKACNESGGLRLLGKALKNCREQGHINLVHWYPPMMSLVCAKALKAGIEVEYVRELVRRRGLVPPEALLNSNPKASIRNLSSNDLIGDSQLDSWPYPLRIRTLGGFELLKDGKVMRFSGKVQQKPLAMLKALISFGGRDVPDERIMEALWPESDGDKARQSMKFTLHALRKLLGDDRMIQAREGTFSVDPRYCSLDVWDFQKITGQTGALAPKNKKNTERLIAMCRRGADLYAGAFLSGDDRHAWVIPLREKLKHQFIRLIELLASCHELKGQYKEAIEAYRDALDVDELQEEFYRRLMLCHQKLGQRAEALSVYNRLKAVLSSAFGLEPSRETEAVKARLLKL